MTEHKHYLSAGGMVFAMQITRSGNLAQGGSTKPAENLQYLHTDHLGSVAVITDQDGSVTERLAYDPWGKRRFPNGTADTNDTIVGLTMDRGFTMHEHLDEMGLIHMNGRIFDPLIGRFMSADPFIQAPENLQSHNRFAYVMNNPLSYTDPSGYFSLKKLFRAAFKIFAPILSILPPKIASVLINVASVAFCGPAAPLCAGAGQAALAYYHGASFGDAVRTGVRAGVTAYLFQQAGDFAGANGGPGSAAGYAAHAAVGCITAVANGGSCGRGALTSAISYGATDLTKAFGDTQGAMVGRFAVTVAVGGAVSKLSGGSFSDGAQSAAYGFLFNELLHQGDRREAMRRAGYKDGGSTFQADMDYAAETGGCMRTAGPDICMGPGAIRGVGNAAAKFFEGTTLADRVVGQMKLGDNHAFPAAVDTFAARYGSVSTVLDSRGNPVNMLTVNGVYNGAKGTFEYIKNQSGQIYHRFFKPN
jgi:RHS repeat-associated protein